MKFLYHYFDLKIKFPKLNYIIIRDKNQAYTDIHRLIAIILKVNKNNNSSHSKNLKQIICCFCCFYNDLL